MINKADLEYQRALRQILADGVPHEDRTGVGTTSLFGEVQMAFDLREGFPLLTTKKLPLRWIFVELMWFLLGRTDNDYLKERGIDIWDEWADEAHTSKFGRQPGDLGPVYGFLWRNFGASKLGDGSYAKDGFDQITWLLNEMKTNPNSRRLIITGWDPETQGLVDLPPCHTLYQFKIENNEWLSCKLYQRSADFFLGVPFNIASYALLTHLVAKIMGLKPKKFIHTFGDAHIYRNHFEQVQTLLSRDPNEFPTIEITGDVSDITKFEWDNVKLNGYNPHGKIEAPVAV